MSDCQLSSCYLINFSFYIRGIKCKLQREFMHLGIAIQERQDESPCGEVYFFPLSTEESKRLKLLVSGTEDNWSSGRTFYWYNFKRTRVALKYILGLFNQTSIFHTFYISKLTNSGFGFFDWFGWFGFCLFVCINCPML